MEKLSKATIDELLKRKYDFDAIGAAIATHTRDRSSIADLSLDVFYDKDGNVQEYIVLRWLNGGFEARNASGNSLNLDIREAAALIDGGYYKECDDYTRLRKDSTRF